jgi:hypothetical protein
LSAIGIPILAFTLTFAAFDWLMSLQAGWNSNVLGIYVFTSGLIAALAIIAVGTWLVERRGLIPGVGPDHVHAIGRLLLMAVILWAYIGFFQLVLIWIANIPHEVSFYVSRNVGAWSATNALLVFGRFGVPFIALLSRPLKRHPGTLAIVGVWLFVTSAVEFAWFVLPSLGLLPSPLDLLPFVAITGVLWAYGTHTFLVREREAQTAPLAESPILQEALRYRSP